MYQASRQHVASLSRQQMSVPNLPTGERCHRYVLTNAHRMRVVSGFLIACRGELLGNDCLSAQCQLNIDSHGVSMANMWRYRPPNPVHHILSRLRQFCGNATQGSSDLSKRNTDGITMRWQCRETVLPGKPVSTLLDVGTAPR